MTTFTTVTNQIESLYVGYFGRAGDPAGVSYWSGLVSAGTLTLAQVAASYSVQPESTAKYPYLANPSTGDPSAFVDQVYQNMFNHVADPAGKAYWVAQLQAAQGNPAAIGSMILNIISGAIGVDDTTIINKVDVAADFTTKAAASGATWTTGAAAQSATEITATNSTAASVTAAKAATDVYFASFPGSQQTFTLAIDSLTTTAQNVNFNAPLVFNAPTGTLVNSLQSSDSAIDTAPLTGPGLSNGGTFTAVLNGAGAIPLVTLQGIPTHTVTNLVAASGYNGNITGLTTFTNSLSAFGLTIGAAGNGIDNGGVAGTTTTGSTLLGTVNINNITGGATTLIVKASALAGATDALTINVVGAFGAGGGGQNTVSVKNDAAAAGATDNAYETISVNASGTTFMALADATSGILSTTRINVAGAGATTLFGAVAENFSRVTTIDANTQSGGVTITGLNTGATGLLAGNTVLSSFKGGTGADSLDISSLSAAQVQAITAGNLDGGAVRDTLILSNGAATTAVALNNSNFETIGITGLAGTVDYSKFGAGVDTLTLSSAQAANAIFNNMTSGLTVALGANNTAAYAETFNSAGSGTADVITVTHSGAAGASLGALTYSGFEFINENLTLATAPAAVTVASITATASLPVQLTLNDASTASLTITGTTNVGVGGTVNVSGAGTGGVVFTGAVTAAALNAGGLVVASTAAGVTLTAAPTGQISILGSSGIDVLRGSTVADAVSGGSGNDTIDANKGADVWSGGAGTDTFGGLTTGNDLGLQGEGVAASGSGLTATIAQGQTITFATGTIGTSNVDRITDFVSGVDKLDVVNAGVTPTSLIGADATANFATNGITYVLYGNYATATGVFTVAAGWSATTADAIIENGSANVVNASTGWVLLTGLNQALIAADFI